MELLESIREDNELTIELRVNAAYPEGAGLSRLPPAVLRSLRRLPEHLEYRFVDPAARHVLSRPAVSPGGAHQLPRGLNPVETRKLIQFPGSSTV